MENNYDFPVVQEPVMLLGSNQVIPGKKAIVRRDTGHVFNIASDRYNVIEHRNVIDTFDSIDGLKRTEVKVHKHGAVMFADYEMPEADLNRVEVAKGDITKFFLRVYNSYDLCTGIGFQIRGIRLVCLNGMTVPQKMGTVHFKHFKNMDMDKLTNSILNRRDETMNIGETWRNWMNVDPTHTQLLEFFEDANIGERKTATLLPHCLDRNLWDVFNVLTHDITHNTNSRKDLALSQMNREENILEKFYKYNWN